MMTLGIFRLNTIHLLILSILTSAGIYAQTVQVGEVEVRLNQQNGILNGSYMSFYDNGNRKVEGQFEQNKRSGEWKFYDEEGELIVKRNYESPLCVRQELPSRETECGTEDFENRTFKKIESEMIAGLFRFSRFYSVNENPELSGFSLSSIKSSLTSHDLSLYEFSSEMEILLTKVESESLSKYENCTLVGMLISSEAFFDKDRLVFEERALGVVPVFENNQGEYLTGFGYYYPGARKFFSTQTTGYGAETLDDLFYTQSGVSSLVITTESYYGPKWNEKVFKATLDKDAIMERAYLEARLIEQQNDAIVYVFTSEQ